MKGVALDKTELLERKVPAVSARCRNERSSGSPRLTAARDPDVARAGVDPAERAGEKAGARP